MKLTAITIIAALTVGADTATTVPQICKAVVAHRDEVQAALHEMDDAGKVMMRNGFYRLSVAKARDMALREMQLAGQAADAAE